MLASLLLMGALAVSADDVRPADERMVEHCEYIDDVTGKSGWGGGLGTAMGIKGAKKSARKAAAKLGATHVVWGQITHGMMTTIQARAYSCPRAET